MKTLNQIQKAYFLGIGGIGMSAIARYFNSLNIEVFGYDKTPSKLTAQLEKEGMRIHYNDDIAQIPNNLDIVVYTPAIPNNLEEFLYLQRQNIPILKRAAVLGLISENIFTIAVSGTHGKTSVTALIAHILHYANKKAAAFVGGIMKNYHTNCILSEKPEYIIVEADEYDKSFLHLHPNILVVNSLDADHLDIYENIRNLKNSFLQLCKQVDANGKIFINEKLQDDFQNHKTITFGSKATTAIKFANKRIKEHKQYFDYQSKNQSIKDLKIQQPGTVNMLNTLVAVAVAMECGVDKETIRKALAMYQGVERRFDIKARTNHHVYIDDYAHHPEEINALVDAVRSLYPDKKITGIFQPHLYSRTRDFAKEFADSLDRLDEVILLPIYPAREEPIESVSSALIYNHMKLENKKLLNKEEIIPYLNDKNPVFLLTIGAGDIDRLIEPIEKWIKSNE